MSAGELFRIGRPSPIQTKTKKEREILKKWAKRREMRVIDGKNIGSHLSFVSPNKTTTDRSWRPTNRATLKGRDVDDSSSVRWAPIDGLPSPIHRDRPCHSSYVTCNPPAAAAAAAAAA